MMLVAQQYWQVRDSDNNVMLATQHTAEMAEHNTCSEIKNTAEAIAKISREALNTGCAQDFTSNMKTHTEYLLQLLSSLENLDDKKHVFSESFIECANKEWVETRERAKNAMLEAPSQPSEIDHMEEDLSGKGRSCHFCGITHSPEWRRGPTGSTNLCNACGLFYAKSIKDQLPARTKKSKIQHTSQFKAAKVPRTRTVGGNNMQASERMALCNMYTSNLHTSKSTTEDEDETIQHNTPRLSASTDSTHSFQSELHSPSLIYSPRDDGSYPTSPEHSSSVQISPSSSPIYSNSSSLSSSLSSPSISISANSSPYSTPTQIPPTPVFHSANTLFHENFIPRSPRLSISSNKSTVHNLCSPSPSPSKAMNLSWVLN